MLWLFSAKNLVVVIVARQAAAEACRLLLRVKHQNVQHFRDFLAQVLLVGLALSVVQLLALHYLVHLDLNLRFLKEVALAVSRRGLGVRRAPSP